MISNPSDNCRSRHKQGSHLASCRAVFFCAGFHVVSWTPHSVHVETMRCLGGNYVVSMWKSCSVHLEPCGVHLETTWCSHGNHTVFTWKPHAVHMITTLCPHGNYVVFTQKLCGSYMETTWYPHGNCVMSTRSRLDLLLEYLP